MTVADFGFKPWPSVSALKAAGVTGVVQYVAGGSDSKHITAAQYRALRAAGLDVALVWEQAARTLGTAFDAAGAARATRQAADALGYTGVVYLAADWDVTAAEWPRVRDNMRAWVAELGVGRTGLYSSYDAIGWAARDGVASHFWQSMSTAFSGGRNKTPHPAAHLWQRRGATIGGADVDLNDIRQPNWGQQQEDDMEQTDKLIAATDNANRTVGQVLGDLANLRNTLMTAPGKLSTAAHTAIPAGSVLDVILQAAQRPAAAPVALTDAQLQTFVDGVASKVSAQLDTVSGKVDQLLSRLAAAGDALDG